ncbi:hypothetical protein AB0M43_02935 [Longispora sp. NPDC051575]|uniref:hypothetical protein n=1 Tax=Longispora sp. NPDC051575 TaxID=3154943 RepID=UPI0034389F6B
MTTNAERDELLANALHDEQESNTRQATGQPRDVEQDEVHERELHGTPVDDVAPDEDPGVLDEPL